MQLQQIAAQLYTVRAQCQTEADFANSMQRLRSIGYTAVQISGVSPTISAQRVRSICDGEGLTICATHESGAAICNDVNAVIDRLGVLGCRYTAYPFPHLPITNATEVEQLAALLDVAGAALRNAGLVLCYHNHHMELAKIDGRTVLETIYARTAPANLQAEPDTYWLQYGGADVIAWCRRLAGRLPLLHLKDYAIGHKDGRPQVQMAEVGNGNLEWLDILATADASGCLWYIVEQDICPGDPFDSLQQSWKYLSAYAHSTPAASATQPSS